ncbi:MAG: hypothetical protein ACK52S_13840, partial [Pirellula sp.]
LQDSPIASPPGAPNHAKPSGSFFEPLTNRGAENGSDYAPTATTPAPFFQRMSIRRRSESKPDTVEP